MENLYFEECQQEEILGENFAHLQSRMNSFWGRELSPERYTDEQAQEFYKNMCSCSRYMGEPLDEAQKRFKKIKAFFDSF